MEALSRALRKHYRMLGKLGSAARNKKLTPERRKEIAQKAAATRWATKPEAKT